jgi:hypothetical protein
MMKDGTVSLSIRAKLDIAEGRPAKNATTKQQFNASQISDLEIRRSETDIEDVRCAANGLLRLANGGSYSEALRGTERGRSWLDDVIRTFQRAGVEGIRTPTPQRYHASSGCGTAEGNKTRAQCELIFGDAGVL